MSDITQKQYFAALSTVELYEEFHGDQGMEESQSLSTTDSVELCSDAEIEFLELLDEDLVQDESSEPHLTCRQIYARAKKRIDPYAAYKQPRDFFTAGTHKRNREPDFYTGPYDGVRKD